MSQQSSCEADSECCSGICSLTSCLTCRDEGDICTTDDECSNGFICVNGGCQFWLLPKWAGCKEANKEMGLASPVLLDQNFATGRSFGASGTPSAVLVDAEGKVASEVAVGDPAVLELAGAGQAQAWDFRWKR